MAAQCIANMRTNEGWSITNAIASKNCARNSNNATIFDGGTVQDNSLNVCVINSALLLLLLYNAINSAIVGNRSLLMVIGGSNSDKS